MSAGEPWPPSPRVVSARPASSNEATSTNSGSSTRWTSNWAMRSPRRIVIGVLGVEVDQRHLDLAAVARVDGAGLLTIERPTRAAKPERGCTSPTMPCGIATRDAGADQGAASGCRSRSRRCTDRRPHRRHGHGWAGKIAVQTNHRKTGGHGATDYPWARVRLACASQTVRYRTVVGAVVVVAAGLRTGRHPGQEVNMGIRTLPEWLPYAVLGAVAAGVLLWLGRTEVRGGGTGSDVELRAGRAHLPMSVVRRSAEIPRSAVVGGAGTPARSGRLCAAPGLGGADGSGRSRRSRRSDAVLAGELPATGSGACRAAES